MKPVNTVSVSAAADCVVYNVVYDRRHHHCRHHHHHHHHHHLSEYNKSVLRTAGFVQNATYAYTCIPTPKCCRLTGYQIEKVWPHNINTLRQPPLAPDWTASGFHSHYHCLAVDAWYYARISHWDVHASDRWFWPSSSPVGSSWWHYRSMN